MKKTLRGIKYELKLNKTQKKYLNDCFGCVRFVYNKMLEKKINLYKEKKENITAYQLIKKIPELKQQFSFLNNFPNTAYQQEMINLEKAYNNFFKHKCNFPKFKSKKEIFQSFRITGSCKPNYNDWTIRIPKIGRVKIYKGRNKKIEKEIKKFTISKTKSGRYYASIVYIADEIKKLNNGKSIGIDFGIKHFATLSDGQIIDKQNYLELEEKKLTKLQKSLGRKKEGSKNFEKAREKYAKLYEHCVFQKKDFLHKKSKELAAKYSIICVETLSIEDLKKNKVISKTINDHAFRMFIDMLQYKCDNLIKISRTYPSSQTCSNCGYINKEVKDLHIRSWTCPNCGENHDRDINAAKNILREGLSLYKHKISECATSAVEFNTKVLI